jgi:hypothetical protein
MRLPQWIGGPSKSSVTSSSRSPAVSDLPVLEARGSDVRRHELAVALQAAADAYRETRSFRSPLFPPSSLWSNYRPSDHPVDLPFGFA